MKSRPNVRTCSTMLSSRYWTHCKGAVYRLITPQTHLLLHKHLWHFPDYITNPFRLLMMKASYLLLQSTCKNPVGLEYSLYTGEYHIGRYADKTIGTIRCLLNIHRCLILLNNASVCQVVGQMNSGYKWVIFDKVVLATISTLWWQLSGLSYDFW